MVSLNPNPPETFYSDPQMGMALPNIGAFSTPSDAANADDPSKKIRKPYTITKSRESWTEPEHDKFLEALQLFDRDWKKIEAFVGSKTVIQLPVEELHFISIKTMRMDFLFIVSSLACIFVTSMIRSHAQKYFLKAQKSGTNEHLPPPRPKRKAAHPYPQKASKNAPVLSQVNASYQTTPALPEPGFIRRPDSSSSLRNPVSSTAVSSQTENSPQAVGFTPMTKGDIRSVKQPMVNNCCSSTESTPRTWPTDEMNDQRNHGSSLRVLPDFAQVYSFIGTVFDPNTTGHVQKLKEMDPIDVETVLLLMRNLSINLTSPKFEDHASVESDF